MSATPSQHLLALAGLLHDIGKFALRAGVSGNRMWDAEARREFGYKHAMLSAWFAETFVPEPWRKAVIGPVGNHHRPQTREDRIVQLADHLSAGERATNSDDESRKTHPMQLRSIFTRVRLDGEEHPNPEGAYWPLQPLDLTSEFFPAEPLPTSEAERRYETMWEEFEREAATLRETFAEGGSLDAYIESLQALLMRYLWAVPSAYYKSIPDISLYDHSRMTGALAAVLADADDARIREWLNAPETVDEEAALLVGGDISGVQDFIYTITARGATPGLRGRSFYLQLLGEALARFILRELDLPITNIIYVGGGNFYLLARPTDAEQIPRLRQAITRTLLQHHRGALDVAVEGYPLRVRDFIAGPHLSAAWGHLHERLQRAKRRRFAHLSTAEVADLFQPLGHGGNEETVCAVCGEEHPNVKKDGSGDSAVTKCPPCLAFEDLGDNLRRAEVLLLTVQPATATSLNLAKPAGTWKDVLGAFGLQASVLARQNGAISLPAPTNETYQVALALKDATLADLTPHPRRAVGRRLLVNTTPILTAAERQALEADASFPDDEKRGLPPADRVKPFSVLAHQARGIKRLGVLRMDVDNLGTLFREGLGNAATLSRVAGLSFAVSLYFEGWVGTIAERMQAQFGDRLYAIYSGGDDLFFVGAWDAVVELAIRVRADLTAYTGGHPGIHASGGMVLVPRKYPLYQAAEEAGAAEEAAKRLRWTDGTHPRQKNAFCFLGEALPWSTFGTDPQCQPGFQTVHQLMHFLEDALQKGAPKSLVRRLIESYMLYMEARQAWQRSQSTTARNGLPQTLWGPWTWRMVYTLKRMEKQVSGANVEQLRRTFQANYSLTSRIGLAARWVDILRVEKQNNQAEAKEVS